MQQAHNNYEVFTGEETEAQKGKHGAGKGWWAGGAARYQQSAFKTATERGQGLISIT